MEWVAYVHSGAVRLYCHTNYKFKSFFHSKLFVNFISNLNLLLRTLYVLCIFDFIELSQAISNRRRSSTIANKRTHKNTTTSKTIYVKPMDINLSYFLKFIYRARLMMKHSSHTFHSLPSLLHSYLFVIPMFMFFYHEQRTTNNERQTSPNPNHIVFNLNFSFSPLASYDKKVSSYKKPLRATMIK